MEIRRIEKYKLSKLIEEFKKIHWPNLIKKESSSSKSILMTTVEVVMFMLVFMIFFYLCSVFMALILNAIGG